MAVKNQIPPPNLIGQSPQALVPELFRDESVADKLSGPVVPPPPEVRWLANMRAGVRKEQADDAPHALIIISGKQLPPPAELQLTKMGYTATKAPAVEQAGKMPILS